LFLLSDASGRIVFKKIAQANRASLSSDDVFLVDLSSNDTYPAIYIWIGRKASLNEKRLALHYAQVYLHDKAKELSNVLVPLVSVPLIKMEEGSETDTFAQAFA
jgi:gelsolin